MRGAASVTSTLSQLRRVEILLTELRYERHVRRALLRELVDELDAATSRLKSAAGAARRLLALLDAEISWEDFTCQIDHIASLAGFETHPHEMAG